MRIHICSILVKLRFVNLSRAKYALLQVVSKSPVCLSLVDKSVMIQERRDIILQLMSPPVPVMTDIISPVGGHRRDSFFSHDPGEISQCSQALILPCAPAAAEHHGIVIIFPDPGMVFRHIVQKALHRIVIERAVHPPVIIIGRVVDPRKCHQPAEKLRSSEVHDRRMCIFSCIKGITSSTRYL